MVSFFHNNWWFLFSLLLQFGILWLWLPFHKYIYIYIFNEALFTTPVTSAVVIWCYFSCLFKLFICLESNKQTRNGLFWLLTFWGIYKNIVFSDVNFINYPYFLLMPYFGRGTKILSNLTVITTLLGHNFILILSVYFSTMFCNLQRMNLVVRSLIFRTTI